MNLLSVLPSAPWYVHVTAWCVSATVWVVALTIVGAIVGSIVREWCARIERLNGVEWDGVGPGCDCLVRILDLGCGDWIWTQVSVADGESGGYRFEDSGDPLSELAPGRVITHWALVPEVRG